MNTSEDNGSQSDNNNMNERSHSTYHVDGMQEEKALQQTTKKKVTFIPRKKKKRDMENDSLFMSELFCNPLDFAKKLLLASIGSVEKNCSECENMAVNCNFKDNTKICSTLQIQNAQKNKILNDYSEDSCLAINDSDDESL